MSAESVVFFFLAASAVATAVLMVLQRNPVMSAIYLIGNFFCIAALYLLLRAQLLAVLQVVVYTGAIMVLVIFVIMLLNLGNEVATREHLKVRGFVGIILVAGFLLELLVLFHVVGEPVVAMAPHENIGTVESIGGALFGKYLLPFEMTSLLLLAAIVGAVVLAKRVKRPGA